MEKIFRDQILIAAEVCGMYKSYIYHISYHIICTNEYTKYAIMLMCIGQQQQQWR